MIVPRIKATIKYPDDSTEIIDRIFESDELAASEYERLITKQVNSVSGSVLYEMCDHFGSEGGCSIVASKSWGGDSDV